MPLLSSDALDFDLRGDLQLPYRDLSKSGV